MAYQFDPLDWIDAKYPNRLSTCRGKYLDQPYLMDNDAILEHFRKFLKYEVVWLPPTFDHSTKKTFWETWISRSWMVDNIEGLWRDSSFNEKMNDGSIVTLGRRCYRFQNKEDAVLFKLVWADSDE